MDGMLTSLLFVLGKKRKEGREGERDMGRKEAVGGRKRCRDGGKEREGRNQRLGGRARGRWGVKKDKASPGKEREEGFCNLGASRS